MKPSAKYLVCVDGREESRMALKLACMKARAYGGQVDLLHVLMPADFQTLGGIADRMREERRAEGEQLLAQLCTEASMTHGITPTPLLREGATGDEIVEAVLADADIGMLVVGTSQDGGKLAAWLAAQLGGKLSIPLLMVPKNLTDLQLQSLA